MNLDTNLPFIWQNDSSVPTTLPEVFQARFEEVISILTTHGAILFRSYGIDEAWKLEECTNAFPGDSINYAGGNSPRTKVKGRVYTSTEHPANAHISLHNEMSYAKTWPTYLLFCCHTPAAEGGQTPLADSRRILQELSPEVKQAFKQKGVTYIRNLHGGYGPGASWQETFETSSREEVESYCRANDIKAQWNEEDLRLVEARDATLKHPKTQEEVWFNQADQFHPSTNDREVYEALMEIYEDDPHQMPQYACFNDGSEIPLEMLEHVRRITNQNTITFNWEKGDLLLLDNALVSHGRTPFSGTRKILVSMLS